MSIEYLSQVWTPKVGTRVRVKLGGECLYRDVSHDFQRVNGCTGVVVNDEDPTWIWPDRTYGEGDYDHRFLVKTDEAGPWYGDASHSYHGYFYLAAAELLPVFALGDRVRIRDAARYCAHRHVGEPGQLGRIVNRYDSSSGHVWTVALDELRIGGWTRPLIDEFQDEEMEPA